MKERVSIWNIAAAIIGGAVLLRTVRAETPEVVWTESNGKPAALHFEPWIGGMKAVTSMAWVHLADPNSDVLLALEQWTGQVRAIVRQPDGSARMLPAALKVAVNFKGERGLLGIAVHPNFAANHFVYLCYTRSNRETNDGRSDITHGQAVVRYTLTSTLEKGELASVTLADPVPILEFPYENLLNNGPNSCGGKILFGPDGKLYGSFGDQNRHGLETNEPGDSVRAGILFRINDDGSVPADNPWAGRHEAMLQRTFAIGVRNSFGLAFDPQTGKLWDTENGPDLWDEVNLVPAGFNSGWTYIMGPLTGKGNEALRRADVPADKTLGSHYADPALSWYRCRGLTCAAFVHTDQYGAGLKDTLLLGEVNGSWLMCLRLTGDRQRVDVTSPELDSRIVMGDTLDEIRKNQHEIMFAEKAGTITDLQLGPDGLLYAGSWRDGVIYVLKPGAAPAASTRP